MCRERRRKRSLGPSYGQSLGRVDGGKEYWEGDLCRDGDGYGDMPVDDWSVGDGID